MHWRGVDRTAKIESREREELRGTVKVGAKWRQRRARLRPRDWRRERDRVREGKRKRGREKGRVVHAVLGGERERARSPCLDIGVERSSWTMVMERDGRKEGTALSSLVVRAHVRAWTNGEVGEGGKL